jgi:hypothetical protein
VNATAKKVFQEVSSNATPDYPRLPWPILLEGASVEVARWWHGPTEKRNAWHVVYRIRIFRDVEEERATFSHTPVYRLRADSLEQDFITKAIRPGSFSLDENCVEVRSMNSRKAPAALVAAWDEMVVNVKAIAAKQERRYERASQE